MISCQGYPACRAALWLPSTVLDAAVEEQECLQEPCQKYTFFLSNLLIKSEYN